MRILTEEPEEAQDRARHFERIVVPWPKRKRAVGMLHRARFSKLAELFVWPDAHLLWVPSAIRAGMRALRAAPADAILVFMMPYSAGIVGIALKKLSGRPLILSLDDSPTCSDMHAWYPSHLHAWLAERLENTYVRAADAVIYVSETTRARVASRLPNAERAKLRLIRYGAVAAPPAKDVSGTFTIRYIGGMNGWHAFDRGAPRSLAKRLFDFWNAAGRAHVAELDHRSSSPVFVGRAVQRVLERNPEWRGRVKVEVYGNRYPQAVVDRVLREQGVEAEVSVHGLVSNDEAMRLSASAEMNFITLPARLDGTSGGRISAKTYEHLTTDRPILATVPAGENRDFLAAAPGVACCDPFDIEAIALAIEEAARAFFAGGPVRYDRSALRESLSYDQRARQLEVLLDEIITPANGAPLQVSLEKQTDVCT